MTRPTSPTPSPLERAALSLERAREKIASLERTRSEPIAIVGMGCRFPGGANGPEALWRLLCEGEDAVCDLPEGRWRPDPALQLPGTRRAGFLREPVDRFDAAFFGIAPREAVSLDPQQRLLLEVTWEALEDAGQVPARLAGGRTGVFVGSMTQDYARRATFLDPREMDAYSLTGNTACFTAGRLSYALGLQGPCAAVDTACSSSLVALHLACQSLRQGESDLAIAAGVSLILSQTYMFLIARTQGMAADGRCKVFDERADGQVRGEGCGAVLLKRLSDAQKDGDRIWAVIRGTAVGHDGRSAALTTPNMLAQRDVLRRALAAARVAPDQIGYVEASATGTSLGDSIEVEALKEVLGQPRPDGRPCVLGSVKPNLGHLEAAAGIAGLIKTALVLHHGRIPRHLHFQRPSPMLPLAGTPFVIPGEGMDWPAGPRLAGVSAFGLSGTNAHAVLEQAPAAPPEAAATSPDVMGRPVLLPISARGEPALRALAERYRELLVGGAVAPAAEAIACGAALRRGHHPHRLAVTGRSRAELGAALDAWLAAPSPVSARAAGGAPPRLAFLFPGQGSPWRAAGGAILERWPAFREAVEACDAALRPHLGWSVLERMRAPASVGAAPTVDVAQPMSFALSIGLAALWRAWGVEPDAVAGQGLGEAAAACVAGALELEDAARVVAHGSRLLLRTGQAGAGQGAVAVELLQRELMAALAEIEPRAGSLPIYTALEADVGDGSTLTADHWSRALWMPGRLEDAAERLLEDGFTAFLELGAEPVLAGSAAGDDQVRAEAAPLVAGLRRDVEEQAALLDALKQLYARGASIDWERVFTSRGGPVQLPSYPFQRERFWIEEADGQAPAASKAEATASARRDPGGAAGEGYFEALWDWEEPLPEPAAAPAPGGRWLLVDGGDGSDAAEIALAQELRALLEARGEAAVRISLVDEGAGGRSRARAADGEPQDLETLLHALFPGGAPCRGVVFLGGLGQCHRGDHLRSPADAVRGLTAGHGDALALVQALARMGWRSAPRLWLVTRGAQAIGVESRATDFAQAALWGLWRTLACEGPALRPTRIDLDPSRPRGEATALLRELLAGGAEEEIALRADARWLGRLGRRPLTRRGEEELAPRGGRPFRLEVDEPGVLEALVPRASARRPPGAGEVEIEVEAAGLNFIDVMKAYGVYPDRRPGPVALGAECAGRVVAVGPGVEGLRVGQEVMAFASFCFASHVTVRADFVAPRPRGWSAAQAAAAPVVFMTAWYSLYTQGNIQRGERILIHSATGGTGLAALQLARRAGAEIHATAGSPQKREHLRALGVRQVLDSRSTGWGKEILAATKGEGVDLVLNSLADGAVEESLAALATDGRFLEIGKRDIYRDGRTLSLSFFRKRISFHAVDLLGISEGRPERLARLLREVAGAAERGEIEPLPVQCFPVSEAPAAFRTMAQARHLGKIVITMGQADLQIAAPAAASPRVRADGAYLVTGGGEAATATARWLVEQGARRVVLLGEPGTGPSGEELEALRATGAALVVEEGDPTREPALAGALERIGLGTAPLRGVFHTAGVQENDDAPRLQQAPERVADALAPAVLGALHLHRLTRDLPLDHFVLYSSSASLLGPPGQGNRAAAGAFLDALAHHRRASALPALSIGWAGDGPGDRLAVLDRLLACGQAHIGLLPGDFRRCLAAGARASSSPRLEPLLAGESATAGPGAELRALPRAERAARVEEFVRDRVAHVLRMEPSRVEPRAKLKSLGVDSLTGLELRKRLEGELSLTLPANMIWAFPDVASLAHHLCEAIG